MGAAYAVSEETWSINLVPELEQTNYDTLWLPNDDGPSDFYKLRHFQPIEASVWFVEWKFRAPPMYLEIFTTTGQTP
jgi:hypothetical protein